MNKKWRRSDLHSVQSLWIECLHDLRGVDTVVGHLASLAYLIVTPIVIPILYIWLPE